MQLKTNVTICKINRFIDDEPTQSKWRTLEQQMATNWQLEKDSIAPFHCSFLFLQRNEADWSGGAIDLPDRTSTTNRTTMAKSRRPTIERMIIIFSCFFFLFLFFFFNSSRRRWFDAFVGRSVASEWRPPEADARWRYEFRCCTVLSFWFVGFFFCLFEIVGSG